MDVQFRIRGFAGSRHHNGVPFGTLLGETVHGTMGSAQIEVLAWKARIRRRDASRIELIDHRPGGGMTNLNITEHTELDWK